MKTRFRALAATHKSCVVTRPVGGDGELSASFALGCETGGDLKLELTLSGGHASAPATAMKLVPRPFASPGEKCPVR